MSTRSARLRPWLISAGGYLVVVLALLHPVITSGIRHATVWPEGDASFPIWANGWVAHALSHGENPFFSNAIWAPHGVNLAANTTAVGLAILFTPITWVLGPVGAFNCQLLLIPVVSALAAMVAIRPWVTRWWPCWIAGLLWGFGPSALQAEVWGWTNFLYLVTPPLLFWLVSDVWRFRTLSPRRAGLLGGAIVSVQLLIGAELLVITTIVGSCALVIGLVVLGSTHRDQLLESARRGVRVALWSLCVLIPVAAPVALYIAAGPQHLPNWVFNKGLFTFSSVPWANFVAHGTDAGAFHWGWTPVYPSFQDFSAVLIAVTLVIGVWQWRSVLVRSGLTIIVLSVWLTRGYAALFHPWTILWNLPLIHNSLSNRYAIVAWFGFALVLAAGTDALADALPDGWPTVRRHVVVVAASCAALVQVAYVALPASVIVPQSIVGDPALAQLGATHAHPILVTYPYPLSGRSMVQQASSDFSYALAGAWGPQVNFGTTLDRFARATASQLSEGNPPPPTSRELRALATLFAEDHVNDVVAPVTLTYPLNRGYAQPYSWVSAMTLIYGAPHVVKGEWVWSTATRRATPLVLSPARWASCVHVVGPRVPTSIPDCTLAGAEERASSAR